MLRTLPAIARLALPLLLATCAQQKVLAPASAPPPDAKPALAAPPAALITPKGY